MKTALFAAAALAVAAPAFADDGLEGRYIAPGEANAASVTDQLTAGSELAGMDAVTVIALRAAGGADDALAVYNLTTAPEIVSTQNAVVTGSSQLAGALGVSADEMNRSDLVSAFLEEVSED